MASAIAQQNKKVILMLYSTFAQRAYDYFLNDIARMIFYICSFNHSRINNKIILFNNKFFNHIRGNRSKCNVIQIKGTNIENLIQKYPNNIIDVGIEEEHATVMASAIAQHHH